MFATPRAASAPLRLLTALLAAFVAIGVLIGPLAQPSHAASSERSNASDVAVTAHRGSSGVAPENTIAAVRLALRQHADVMENDIQRTKDDALVIMHDTNLVRTTDVEQVFPERAPWNVRDFTLAEIKRLDAGSWFDPSFAGERVPTLREWVKAVGSRAGMLLEVKAPELYPGIEIDVDKELRSLPGFRAALRTLPPGPSKSTRRWASSTRPPSTGSMRTAWRSTSGRSTPARTCVAADIPTTSYRPGPIGSGRYDVTTVAPTALWTPAFAGTRGIAGTCRARWGPGRKQRRPD